MRLVSFASLRFRLLALVLLAVVPFLGLTLYTNIELRRLAIAGVEQDVLRVARSAASDQRDIIRDTRQLFFGLAQLATAQERDPDSCSAFFSRLLEQYPQYSLLGVAGPEGDLVCSAPPTHAAANFLQQAHFQRALQARDFAVSDYQIDRITDKAVISFAYPVLGAEGQILSVLVASLDLAWLNQLAAEAQLPQGATFTMFDREGTVLARSPDPERWVGETLPEPPIVEAIAEVESAAAEDLEGTTQAKGADGVWRLYAFTRVPGTRAWEEMYVSIGVPTSAAFKSANRTLFRNLIGLGIVTVLVLAASRLGENLFVVRWVDRLLSATRRLSAGDLSVRTGLPYGESEMSQLARAFDEMADSLERRVAERDDAEKALRESQQALLAAQETLEQQVIARTRELSALYDVTAAASASLELEKVLERSLDRVVRVMECHIGAIHLLDEQHKTLCLAASRGIAAESLAQVDTMPINGGLVSWTASHSEPQVVPRVADGPRALLAIPLSTDNASYVGVPMRAKGRVLGVLSIVGEADRQFQQAEVTLLASIADQVGIAIENAQLYRQSEQLATLRERQRLARELHDSVTQSLYSLVLVAEAGRRLAGSGDLQRVEQVVRRLGEIGQQALKEMRLLVYQLRPSALQSEGWIRALQQRLETVERRAGVEARLRVEGTPALPEAVEEELYRIVQEALNNALKHAAAALVVVQVRAEPQGVEIEVTDDGRGFDAQVIEGGGGLGLVTMRERVEKLGGTLTIRSAPGQGTTVRVVLDDLRRAAGDRPA
jgi:signal transduction histidine kinase